MSQQEQNSKQKVIQNLQNLKDKTMRIITDKKKKKETTNSDEDKMTMDYIRKEHHELNKMSVEIERSNEQLMKEIDSEQEKIEEGEEHLKELEELYILAKKRYEEKMNERIEIEKRIEVKNEKIKINNERIKRNEERKKEIKKVREEIEKTVSVRAETAIMNNPRQISKLLRKEILDLMFEADSVESFQEFEDGIVRYTIKDQKDTSFMIDLSLKEEGLVIYTKQGARGKIRLVAVTKQRQRGMVLVEPHTQEQNEEIDNLAKEIIYEIMENKNSRKEKKELI